MTRDPRIPAVRLGAGPRGRQMLRFRRADVEKFIADHREGPPFCDDMAKELAQVVDFSRGHYVPSTSPKRLDH